MSDPFTGARAKVDRAREQTNALAADFQRFYDCKPYVVAQTLDPESRRKSAVFRATEPIPVEWSVILGEVFHDLRSALDNAIYEMICIEQGAALPQTEFPVFEDELKYMSSSKAGVPNLPSGLHKIRGINVDAQKIVRELQPFQARKAHPNSEPILALVHDLNITDKHRTIHLCRLRTDSGRYEVLRDIQTPIDLALPIGALDDGKRLGEWTPTIFDDEPDVEFSIDFAIALADTYPPLKNQLVIEVCEKLTRGVEKIIFTYLRDTL